MTAYGVNAAYKLLCQPKKSAGAGCRYSANYYKAKKQWHDSDPRPGDQIFFWPKDGIGGSAMQHTGLVVAVDATYVYTVEGNTSADSGVVWNGGSVNDKRYKLTYERIAGYGRPDYASVDPDEGIETEATPVQPEKEEEAAAMYIGTAIVTPKSGKGVNFRRTPSKTAGRITGCMTIAAGETVNVKSTDGTWAAIEYNGYQGYMMVEFLQMKLNDTSVEGTDGAAESVDELLAQIIQLVNKLAEKAN